MEEGAIHIMYLANGHIHHIQSFKDVILEGSVSISVLQRVYYLGYDIDDDSNQEHNKICV